MKTSNYIAWKCLILLDFLIILLQQNFRHPSKCKIDGTPMDFSKYMCTRYKWYSELIVWFYSKLLLVLTKRNETFAHPSEIHLKYWWASNELLRYRRFFSASFTKLAVLKICFILFLTFFIFYARAFFTSVEDFESYWVRMFIGSPGYRKFTVSFLRFGLQHISKYRLTNFKSVYKSL